MRWDDNVAAFDGESHATLACSAACSLPQIRGWVGLLADACIRLLALAAFVDGRFAVSASFDDGHRVLRSYRITGAKEMQIRATSFTWYTKVPRRPALSCVDMV